MDDLFSEFSRANKKDTLKAFTAKIYLELITIVVDRIDDDLDIAPW